MTPHDEYGPPGGQPWSPPSVPSPPAESRPPDPRWSIAALGAGIAGVVGALLPALNGQKVGDPGSWAYRVGVVLGLAGGIAAIAAGWYLTQRSANRSRSRRLAGAAAAVGLVAVFLTAALVFSG